MFKSFTPFASVSAFTNSAIDATERAVEQFVSCAPDAIKGYAQKFNQSYFTIVRANAAAANNFYEQTTKSFAR